MPKREVRGRIVTHSRVRFSDLTADQLREVTSEANIWQRQVNEFIARFSDPDTAQFNFNQSGPAILIKLAHVPRARRTFLRYCKANKLHPIPVPSIAERAGTFNRRTGERELEDDGTTDTYMVFAALTPHEEFQELSEQPFIASWQCFVVPG